MAYTKIQPIKNNTHLQTLFDYILNEKKTNDKIYSFAYMCSTNNAVKEFETIRILAMKKGNNIAHHLYQCFSPEDNITPEKSIEIGKQLMKKMYPNHQYILATHIDKGHIHNHILINSVDFKYYKKINSNRESLQKIRRESDELCIKNNLSIIKPIPINHRNKLKENIDNAIEKSNSFDDFLNFMKAEGYDIKQGKCIAFKPIDGERFIRAESLGIAYTEKKINEKINLGNEIPNRKKQVYDDKAIKISNRKRLKYFIDKSIEKSNSFEEFLNFMRAEGYKIKQGENVKHIAFKPIDGERFIRAESLGDNYSEIIIRLRIEDEEQFRRIKAQQENEKIDKIIKNNGTYNVRWVVNKNVDTEFKVLNFLESNNINSYEELIDRINNIKNISSSDKNKIDEIQSKINDKNKIINAIKIYWQYKPIADQVRDIKDIPERNIFKEKNKDKLDRLKKAIEIMNNSKINGELPKVNILNSEINNLLEDKNLIYEHLKNTKKELVQFENIKYNLDEMIGLRSDERAIGKKNINKNIIKE